LRNDWSTFEYTYGGSDAQTVATAIASELNGGFAFRHHHDYEETIETRLETTELAIARADGETITVSIADAAFLGYGVTSLLTQCWGNALDFGNLHLDEFHLSKELTRRLTINPFPAEPPAPSIRRILQLSAEIPLTGTVLKESTYRSTRARAALVKQYADHGIAIIKEDETYTPGADVVLEDVTAINAKLGASQALYVPNISGCVLEPAFTNQLNQSGVRIVMINIWITGWNWAAEVTKRLPNVSCWFHRVGYESLTSTLGMVPFLRCARLAGASFIHVGTPFLSSRTDVARTRRRVDALRDPTMMPAQPPIPVFSKTTKETVGELVRRFGPDVCVMACGDFRENRAINWDHVHNWTAAANLGAHS